MALLLGLVDCRFQIVKIVKYVWIFHSCFSIVSKMSFFFSCTLIQSFLFSYSQYLYLGPISCKEKYSFQLPEQYRLVTLGFCFVFNVSGMIHLIKPIAIPPNASCMFFPPSLGNPHFIPSKKPFLPEVKRPGPLP